MAYGYKAILAIDGEEPVVLDYCIKRVGSWGYL